MADWLTVEQRSRVMQAIKSKDTGPEMLVRRLVHGLGYRYRLHKKGLPGRPDLVFAGRKKIIFVHGCFWHAHDCRFGRAPKSRQDYWIPKLRRNKERDEENRTQLEALGWEVLTIWECQLKSKDRAELVRTVTEFLDRESPSGRGQPKGKTSSAQTSAPADS